MGNTRASCREDLDRRRAKTLKQIFWQPPAYVVTARERRKGGQNKTASIREKNGQLLRCARRISDGQAWMQVANHQSVKFNYRRELQPVAVNRGY